MKDYDLVKIFKALADKTRQDILELLFSQDNANDLFMLFSLITAKNRTSSGRAPLA